MTATAKKPEGAVLTILDRPSADHPIFALAGQSLAVLAGTRIGFGDQVVAFDADQLLAGPDQFEVGQDYEIALNPDGALSIHIVGLAGNYARPVVGGFHFAPGGNAFSGREGGSTTPGINTHSIWDQGFRPACPEPRGMAFVSGDGIAPFWADLYLTARNHTTAGTSRFGAEIADGYKALPDKPGDGEFEKLDYAAAQAIAAQHGKRLMSFVEFAAAAYGVEERSADGEKANYAGLSSPRTSKFGLMQATGQRWIWGHDGDPDDPRASIFGGSWFGGRDAGSRYAHLVLWPERSGDVFGLRLASDHLTTV